MVEAKRPRGRPRKHPLPSPAPVAPNVMRAAQGLVPALIGEPLMALGDEPISVIVHFRVALSQPGVEELVEWPRGWPIPAQGDQVKLGALVGFVAYITYDLTDKTLHVSTR